LLKTKTSSWGHSPQVLDYQDFSIIGRQIKEILPCCIVLTPVMTDHMRDNSFTFIPMALLVTVILNKQKRQMGHVSDITL